MKMKLILLSFVLIVVLTGCQEEDLSNTAMVAKEYLEEEGYKIISYKQRSDSYTLTQSKLESGPYEFYWSLPGNDPTPHMDKTVDVEEFIVKNHPLDKWKSGWIRSTGKTHVYVYIVEGDVVGGNSFPSLIADFGLGGGYYNLHGEN